MLRVRRGAYACGGSGVEPLGQGKGSAMQINFSEDAVALAKARGGVLAMDYIPPIG